MHFWLVKLNYKYEQQQNYWLQQQTFVKSFVKQIYQQKLQRLKHLENIPIFQYSNIQNTIRSYGHTNIRHNLHQDYLNMIKLIDIKYNDHFRLMKHSLNNVFLFLMKQIFVVNQLFNLILSNNSLSQSESPVLPRFVPTYQQLNPTGHQTNNLTVSNNSLSQSESPVLPAFVPTYQT